MVHNYKNAAGSQVVLSCDNNIIASNGRSRL